MKATFKPLGLAAAVAAVTAGYAGIAQAQPVAAPVGTPTLANNSLGDAAIIPYYTVAGDFVTGVHIINTDKELTTVVKLRMRRGSDSMDALDFNIVLSPEDEWTGFIDDSTGTVVMATEDNSCTAPLRADGRFAMPGLYQEGATEGYLEIIAMAQIDEDSAIAVGAEHTSEGVPFDCEAVESNFFRNTIVTDASVPTIETFPNEKGVLSSAATNQTCTTAIALATGALTGVGTCTSESIAVLTNVFGPAGNVLKVSYFHRDATSGLEFGNSAVHLADFANGPMMTNQEIITVGESDPWGFLFPDLDGGSPADATRGSFECVRTALGADSIINDWSVVAVRNVSTDWVVTLPGQYLMLDLATYTESLFDADVDCLTKQEADKTIETPEDPEDFYCDFRDLPVNLKIRVLDREEQTFSTPDSGLVISPSLTNQPGEDTLVNEVNVIQWSDGSNEPVLPSEYGKVYDTSALGASAGWASLNVSAATTKTQGIYNFGLSGESQNDQPTFDSLTETSVPIVGFVAWERSFPSDPSANYGRIVEHSYESN